MKTEWWIARRLYGTMKGKRYSSRLGIRLALAGIIVGVTIIILTLCIVVGFKRTITDKVACVGAHIRIVNFESNNTYELSPIVMDDSLLTSLHHIPHITHITPFCTKPGIIKTDSLFQGVVVKSVQDWSRMQGCVQEGHLPCSDNEVMVSQDICQQMNIHLGERIFCYFVGENVRVRRWTIVGIYSTGLKEADERFIWCTMPAIRQLNNWSDSLASGIEVMVDERQNIPSAAEQVWFATAYRLDNNGQGLYSETLDQLNPQVFAWLDLLDMNVLIVIILMLCVSGFNIISGLLILILDSVRLIGTLKALGADNRFVRKIFVIEAIMLVGKGIVWGNGIGLGLAAIQSMTHIIPLDSATYYMSYVPIAFPWAGLLLMDLGVVVVSLLVLLAPSALATHISPSTVMRYE